ncbi:MAG: hypothetical protein KF802_02715 [Bdellovibrionaceae bacterium]|nr:hypothetical protein [Pseudobdellovibrionaceae bacterium]
MRYLLLTLFLVGCASVPKGMNDYQRDMAIKSGSYDEVLEDMVAKKPFVKEKDYLLHQLNYAMVLYYDGKYKESNAVFSECQQYIDYGSDSTSVQQATGVVIDPSAKKYPIDEYEILSISLFKMLNALNSGNIQNAQAESRRLERVGNLLSDTRKYNLLEETAFHTYFSGIIWESQKSGDWSALDTSYVNYKKAYNFKNRKIPYLPFDLTRLAVQLNRPNDVDYWQKQFPYVPKEYPEHIKRKVPSGELIIIFTYGLGPRKTDDPTGPFATKLSTRFSTVNNIKITVDDKDYGETFEVMSFDDLAEANYKNRYSGVVGTIGNAFGMGFHDYRTWELLPKAIQIGRVTLSPGTHEVILEVSPTRIETYKVTIENGKKSVIHINHPN